MKFIITVDTEADNQWKSSGGGLTLENIKAIPRFQSLCEIHGFSPTYLVTYEVADSDEAMSVLLPLERAKKAEIGAHLHPWTTPPYFDLEKEQHLMHFPSELSDQYLEKKFLSLHERITQRLGYAPVSFRAGRWGLDSRVVALLEKYRYSVDCSVTPYVNWKLVVRGGKNRTLPNFLLTKPNPYMLSSHVAEIPMTILPKSWEFVSTVGAKFFGRGSMAVSWCRIFPETTIHELIDVYYKAVKEGLPFLEFMIHSSELVRGGSPYTKSQESVNHLYDTLEEFFEFLKERGAEGVLLRDAATMVKQGMV